MEFLIGGVLGILAGEIKVIFLNYNLGLLLRSFPRNDATFAHFMRGVLLITTSTAFYFGTRAINCPIGGPVAVILCSIVASMRWKIDNHKMVKFIFKLIYLYNF